ncbi:phosphate signaling complex protein PhoU [Rhodococcus kyotonensis]|uniref:Phosphate-specific transport system accessory protein PhoU n=1 Tax=Rhodococcoides kyotonense TaxID=398843 RepID=A0A177YKH9_9NOCA|nr:phosphate signaling complex protein PhoU [Rhodococcus kyotonensis]NIL78327.1 Phosphate-specific transport system accessory protein-2 [Rhodococcus sp. B10]OAK55568.1 phosphate transport system regulatory protein PhoU [Rhodococcus kyotonensis]
MRENYNSRLDALSADLAEMCTLAEDAMASATKALLTADLGLAETTISSKEQIDVLAAQWEQDAFSVLALQSPVALDLRIMVSGIHIVADLQRMGGLAIHIAELVRRRHPAHVLPDEVEAVFADMGRVAVEQADAAREVLLTRDADLAKQLRVKDEAMDDLHRSLFELTSSPEWPHGVPAAVDITLLGRFYERYSDHTVEVARRVTFLVTGELRPDDA